MKLLATLLLAAAPLVAQQKPMADAMPAKPPVPPSHALNIVYNGHTTTFTVEDLLKFPQVTIHVHNAHRDTDETYNGPLLSEVLAKAGLAPTHENEQEILHSVLFASATDNYYVVYSAAEVEPAFSKSQVIVAITKGNDLPNSEGGNIQLINTDGAKPARWVHGLNMINVVFMKMTVSK